MATRRRTLPEDELTFALLATESSMSPFWDVLGSKDGLAESHDAWSVAARCYQIVHILWGNKHVLRDSQHKSIDFIPQMTPLERPHFDLWVWRLFEYTFAPHHLSEMIIVAKQEFRSAALVNGL